MARQFRSSDPYQASTRNFGPAQSRRAPIDAVDAKLEAVGIEIQNLGIDIASLPAEERSTKIVEMTALCARQSDLRVERDQIIRTFFYGGRR